MENTPLGLPSPGLQSLGQLTCILGMYRTSLCTSQCTLHIGLSLIYSTVIDGKNSENCEKNHCLF